MLLRASRLPCSRLVQHSLPLTRLRMPISYSLARYYANKSFPPHTVVTMPALSPTMTAGNIGAWQKSAGDVIAPGDVLVEIETDKAQMDFEFQEDGVLAKVLKDTGEKDVVVGNPIAVLVEEGQDVSAFESFTLADAGGEKTPKATPKEEASQSSEPPSSGSKTAPPSADNDTDNVASSSSDADTSSGRLQTSLDREPNASPSAKALALEKGVPIKKVKGTGPAGRVTKQDVEKYTSSPSTPTSSGPSYTDTPASSMRKTIANRLTESVNQNPHYFVSSTISVSRLLKLRQALNTSAAGAYKLSLNDFLIKACAIACKAVPMVNSSWRVNDQGETVVREFHTVDISVAVATPVGLMTPIVHNADSIGLKSISSTVKDLGKRAREGKLKPEEYQGGSFTISNMGMNDAVERFTAVINPPQAGILAVGTTKQVAVPGGGQGEDGKSAVVFDEQIVVTASFDHKVVDGAVGGEWIREFKKVVENPLEMML